MIEYANACSTCTLVSNGFDNRELGLDDDYSTPAVHYRLEPVEELEFIDTCDYCTVYTLVRTVIEHDYLGC